MHLWPDVIVDLFHLQMLTAATFLSSTDLNEFSLPQEALKAIIGSGDLLGIYLLLNYVRGDGTIKWLAVGLGGCRSLRI